MKKVEEEDFQVRLLRRSRLGNSLRLRREGAGWRVPDSVRVDKNPCCALGGQRISTQSIPIPNTVPRNHNLLPLTSIAIGYREE